MSRTCDVVIVGGGIIGTACAWALAREGLSAVLIESREIAQGASGLAQGGIGFGALSQGWDLEWQLASLQAHDLLAEDGIEAGYQRCGALVLARTEHDVESLKAAAARLSASGVAAEWIDAPSLSHIEPHLAPIFLGALRRNMGGHVVPTQLAQALARRACERGARIATNEIATRIIFASGKVQGIETSAGQIHAPIVVLSAGLGSVELARTADVKLPLDPVKGHMVVAGPAGHVLQHYIVEHQPITPATDRHVSTVLQNLASGHIMIGMTRLRRDALAQDEKIVIDAMMRRATDTLPALKKLPIISERVGSRPGTPDNRPIIGFHPDVQGLLLATGHGGEGILGAPMTGVIVADLVRGRTPQLGIEPLSPARWRTAA